MKYTETNDDVENVEAWAEIITHVLFHVPQDKRAAVLKIATTSEEKKEKARATNPFTPTPWSGIINTDEMQRWHTVVRLKSLLVQVFVRSITNNHSPADAAAILFSPHPHGTGSRRLLDYIGDLIPPQLSDDFTAQ